MTSMRARSTPRYHGIGGGGTQLSEVAMSAVWVMLAFTLSSQAGNWVQTPFDFRVIGVPHTPFLSEAECYRAIPTIDLTTIVRAGGADKRLAVLCLPGLMVEE